MKRTILEAISLISVPTVLVVCVLFDIEYSALITTIVVVVAFIPFVIGLERDDLKPENIMPIVVLSALAVAGRIIFAPLPNIKPVSAIVIVAGVVFGRRSGFMVGMLAALISNFFFGQGPWTLWQMYAWGLMGYGAGALAQHGILKGRISVMIYGALAPVGYGFILDSYYFIGFVAENTVASALAAYGVGFAGSAMHASATVVFLALIYLPWVKKLERIKRKYGISEGSTADSGGSIADSGGSTSDPAIAPQQIAPDDPTPDPAIAPQQNSATPHTG